jgi:uncharacterized protein YutD
MFDFYSNVPQKKKFKLRDANFMALRLKGFINPHNKAKFFT